MRKPWQQHEIDLLKNLYANHKAEQIASQLGRSESSVQIKAARIGLKQDKEFVRKIKKECNSKPRVRKNLFQKGGVPWNKGKSFEQSEASLKFRFAKGHDCYNELPVGSLRINADGYLERKEQRSPAVWRLLHHIIWEEAHGPIPEGMVVAFKAGRPIQNPTIEDIELVSRADIQARNSIQRFPQDLQQALRAVKKLMRKIKEREENEKHND